MPLYQRLRYAVYLATVGSALVSLAIAVASADVVGLLPTTASDYLMSPGYYLIAFAVAFLAAPSVAPHFPIAWEAATSAQKNSAKNTFAMRLMILAGIGLLLALLSNLLVYILR